MIKNKSRYTINCFNFLLIACAICQLLLTTYFTIFEGKLHMDVDSSWEYLKAIVAAKEGVIYPFDYVNITTQPEFEKLILTVPLFRIIGNVFWAFGLTNLFINLISVFLIYKASKNFGFKTTTALIMINLFECPFLANGYSIYNELGWYECVLGFGAHYNLFVLVFLLTILFFSMEQGKSTRIIGVINIVMIAYVTMWKGIGIIIWIGLPIIAYLLIKMFIKNEWRVLIEEKSLFLFGFVFAITFGRLLGDFTGYVYLDSATNWVTSSEFVQNFSNVVLGFGVLLGGIPAANVVRPVASFTGLVFVFGLIISGCMFVAVIYNLVKLVMQLKKGVFEEKRLFTVALFFTSTTMLLFMAPYLVEDYYSVRYLMAPSIAGFFMIGMFIEDLKDELIFKKMGIAVLFISIAIMDLYSDYFLGIVDNTEWRYEELLETIETTDAGLIYFWDDGMNLVHPEKVLRVIDSDRVYKCISKENQVENFGDYKYYYDTTEYQGSTVLVTPKDNSFIPQEIMDKYTAVDTIGDYQIYYSKENPIDVKSIVVNY